MSATVVLTKEVMERTLAGVDTVKEACAQLGITIEKWRWWAKVYGIHRGRARIDTLKYGTVAEKHRLRVQIIIENILDMPGFWDLNSILQAIDEKFCKYSDIITTKDVIEVLQEMEIEWYGTRTWRFEHDNKPQIQHHSPQIISR